MVRSGDWIVGVNWMYKRLGTPLSVTLGPRSFSTGGLFISS